MELNKKNLKEIVNAYEQQVQNKTVINEKTELLKMLENNIRELNYLINRIENNIKSLKLKSDNLNKVPTRILHPLKTRKEKKSIIAEINNLELKLRSLIEQLSMEENHKKEVISQIESQKNEISFLPDCFEIINNIIVVNDKSISTKGQDFSDNPQELMIHVTDFYPKERKLLCNYDGNKYGFSAITHRGVTKKVESLIHRHSVHFTINNVVTSTSDGAGSWEQPKYVIIDSMEEHKHDNIKNLGYSDSWTYGSIELSDKALLLVNENYINDLPEEAYNDYKVLIYSGNYTKCVKNIISSTTGTIYLTDSNSAGHHASEEMISETILNKRNLLINYIKDNKYRGKEEITFSKDELLILFEMMIENNPKRIMRINNISENAKKYNVDESILYFYYLFGFTKKQNDNLNNTFTIKNDEEMYRQICNLDNIDAEQLKMLTDVLQSKNQLEINTNNISEQQLSMMTIKNLYKFENQKYAEYFYKMINKEIEENLGNIAPIYIDRLIINNDGKIEMEINLYSGMNLSENFEELSFEKEYDFYHDYNFTIYKVTSKKNMLLSDFYMLMSKICQTVKIESQRYKQENLNNYDNNQSYHK